MRCLKMLICVLVLFATCSCAQMFAEETVVEVYRLDGSLLGKAYSNKGYDGFKCIVKIDGDKQDLEWSANKVNSDTVAVQALEANKELTKTIAGLVNAAAGLAIGLPQ